MSKILVADDSRFQVALLTKALQEKGFEVVAAQDALQAGMVALRTAPDAILARDVLLETLAYQGGAYCEGRLSYCGLWCPPRKARA